MLPSGVSPPLNGFGAVFASLLAHYWCTNTFKKGGDGVKHESNKNANDVFVGVLHVKSQAVVERVILSIAVVVGEPERHQKRLLWGPQTEGEALYTALFDPEDRNENGEERRSTHELSR